MAEELKQFQDFLERFEKAAAETRGSLTPAVVKQLVDDVKEIKKSTECIPIMEERQRVLHKKVEDMSLHHNRISILENNQGYIIKGLWAAGAALIGLGIEAMRRMI